MRDPNVCAPALSSFLRAQLTKLLRAHYKGFVLTIQGTSLVARSELCPKETAGCLNYSLRLASQLTASFDPRKMFARSLGHADMDEFLSSRDSRDSGTNCHGLADDYHAFPSTRELRVRSKQHQNGIRIRTTPFPGSLDSMACFEVEWLPGN